MNNYSNKDLYLLRIKKNNKKYYYFAFILLLVFSLGVAVQNFSSYLPSINKIVGGLIFCLFIVLSINKKLKLPIEIWFLSLFIIWGLLISNLIAIDYKASINYLSFLFQILLIVISIIGFIYFWFNLDFVFVSIIITSVVIVLYSIFSGDLSNILAQNTTARAVGFLTNPNELGLYGFLGITSIFWFWKHPFVKIPKIFILLIIFLLTIGIIASGSRKSFVALIFFLILWVIFCFSASIKNNFLIFIMAISILLSSIYFVDYIYDNTSLGERLKVSMDNPEIDTKRIDLYREGLIMFQRSPITGVGLGNFPIYSRHNTYSHSDYIETLATTGLVGFLLYHFIYISLFVRIFQLKKMIKVSLYQYRLGYFFAILLSLMLLAFTRINFLNVYSWITIAAIIGYTHKLKNLT